MKKSLKVDIILIIVTIFWGAGFPVTKIALETMGPLYHIGFRFIVASALLALIFNNKLKLINKEIVKAALVLSTFLFATYVLQTVGLQYTTASKSAFYSGLAVMFVPIFSIFYSKSKLRLNSLLSIITAVLGLFLLSYNKDSMNFNIGDFMTVLCSASYGWNLLFTGSFVQKHDATLLSILQLFFVSIYGMISALLFEPFPSSMSAAGFGSLMFSAVLCTAFAFWVQATVQKETAASHVALVFTLEPVFGAIMSYLFLKEILGWIGILGGLMIFIAMIISELELPWAKLQDKPK